MVRYQRHGRKGVAESNITTLASPLDNTATYGVPGTFCSHLWYLFSRPQERAPQPAELRYGETANSMATRYQGKMQMSRRVWGSFLRGDTRAQATPTTQMKHHPWPRDRHGLQQSPWKPTATEKMIKNGFRQGPSRAAAVLQATTSRYLHGLGSTAHFVRNRKVVESTGNYTRADVPILRSRQPMQCIVYLVPGTRRVNRAMSPVLVRCVHVFLCRTKHFERMEAPQQQRPLSEGIRGDNEMMSGM